MGRRNFLVEGVSGTGKTSVCDELQRRGFHAIHGDRELAYQGDPKTGEPLDGSTHEHHIWRVDAVRALVADTSAEVTFFCGGSRNSGAFIDLFDDVFVLEVDLDTLTRRLVRHGPRRNARLDCSPGCRRCAPLRICCHCLPRIRRRSRSGRRCPTRSSVALDTRR